MILFRRRFTLREEQCRFRKGRGCVNQILTLRLIIKKYLSYRTPLVLSFIYREQSFDSVDKKSLAKVLYLYGKPEKQIKVIFAIYKDNTATVNNVSSWFSIKSGV